MRFQNAPRGDHRTLFQNAPIQFIGPAFDVKTRHGPLGGAKLAASGLSKGPKALKAAIARLGQVPIYLPVGVGAGEFVKVKPLVQPLSAWAHRKALRDAVEFLYKVQRATRKKYPEGA